jgi:hypothetical protein
MRREAVQEERHRANGRESRGGDLDGTGDLSNLGGEDAIGGDMPLERIIEAENRYPERLLNINRQCKLNTITQFIVSTLETTLCLYLAYRCDASFQNEHNDNLDSTGAAEARSARDLLRQLIDWAKRIPYFTNLRTEDQVREREG